MKSILTTLLALGSSLFAAERPNFLFIAVDDLRTEINCFGADHIKSPNLDRLAAGGTAFLNAHCELPFHP